MKTEDFFDMFFEILIWISFIIVCFMLLWKIFGNSPAESQIIYAITSGVFVYLIGFSLKAGKFAGKVEEFMSNAKLFMGETKESFRRFEIETKEAIGKMNRNILELKADLKQVR